MGLVNKFKQAFLKAVRSHNSRLVRLQEALRGLWLYLILYGACPL